MSITCRLQMDAPENCPKCSRGKGVLYKGYGIQNYYFVECPDCEARTDKFQNAEDALEHWDAELIILEDKNGKE